jgi:hypothetical protein
MSANDVVWPTGMSDQDPAARERPLFFNPRGFLVAVLEDADQAEQARAALADAGFADRDLRAVRCLVDHQVLHFRHYGHDRQDDLHIR